MTSRDLTLNKDLLDLKFEGYKLSLDPIPVLKQPVVDGVECPDLINDEYSYLQVRMSALLNHLFQDPWCNNSVFYINKKHFIYWTSLSEDGRLASPRLVWLLAVGVELRASATLCFPGSDWAVLSNGSDTVSLLHTPSRPAGEPWTCCHNHILLNSTQCYILHAVHRSFPNGQQIDCLIATVVPKSTLKQEVKNSDGKSFVSMLEWISFSCGQNIQVWTQKRTRRLVSTSPPEYASIDTSGDAVCVISENEYKLIFDSERPVEILDGKDIAAPVASLYTYMQTSEDITVVFRLPESTNKSDVQVNVLPSQIEVLLQGQCVLKGHLSNCVDTGSSKWIIDKQKLEVTLSKAEVGLMWQELIKGDNQGEELMDPELVEEIHLRLAHLTSDTEAIPSSRVPFNLEQLEECDTSNEPLTFQRIDGNNYVETHKINMGGHQWLFTQQICPESLPAICLRHDVDGILWQPKNVSSEGELEQFKMEHVATFSALGYVQASKQDKKFVSCSPDFRYSVISDCSRHVYVYCQPENLHSALELRNRKTGESISHIAKQYVISLEQCDKILGLQVSPHCIFILSKQMLYAAKMLVK